MAHTQNHIPTNQEPQHIFQTGTYIASEGLKYRVTDNQPHQAYNAAKRIKSDPSWLKKHAFEWRKKQQKSLHLN